MPSPRSVTAALLHEPNVRLSVVLGVVQDIPMCTRLVSWPLTSEGVWVESLVMEVVEEQNWRSGLGGESVKSFMCLGEG